MSKGIRKNTKNFTEATTKKRSPSERRKDTEKNVKDLVLTCLIH